jgi:hypothetical protein
MFEEVVLEEASLDGTVLFDTPIAIATTGFPIGHIALGDDDAVFVKGADDFGVGDVVAEHAVDHVTDGMGEAGDFAVATNFAGAASEWIIGLVD